MEKQTEEKPALLIVDMLKDSFDEKHNLAITPIARKIIAPINEMIGVFRRENWPIVFPSDAFHEDDFFFKGKMKPHSIAGTPGAEVTEELDREEEDYWLPKPRFSAFFDTGLEDWLRERGVTLCAVAGITTNFCVLTTVLDAICCDFKAVLLEDCTAAISADIHEKTLDLYRRNVMGPLLRVTRSTDIIAELTGSK
ncbi:MAG: cysteine hydrolase [Desulfobacterales bacterium]|nr:cysteine hydrolase [Desulfobacterales bacterium]